jgi:anaerobic selenocysteine-containing dehydrogenase
VPGDWVDLVSHYGAEQRRAARFRVVVYEIPVGCAAAYFPETNVLVAVHSVAEGSNQPASKSVVITVEPSPASHLEHQPGEPGVVAEPQHG